MNPIQLRRRDQVMSTPAHLIEVFSWLIDLYDHVSAIYEPRNEREASLRDLLRLTPARWLTVEILGVSLTGIRSRGYATDQKCQKCQRF